MIFHSDNTFGNIENRIFEENIWLIPCLSHDKYLILWQLETALRPWKLAVTKAACYHSFSPL